VNIFAWFERPVLDFSREYIGGVFSIILGIQNAAKSKNCAIFKPKHLNAYFYGIAMRPLGVNI